jgi:predicted nucleic acid-binding protein
MAIAWSFQMRILAEVTKVLRYPRFQALYGLTESDLLNYIQFLQSISHVVNLDPQYHAPLRDPNDHRAANCRKG